MNARLSRKKAGLLTLLKGHRYLTVRQAAYLLGSSEQMARRHFRQLADRALVSFGETITCEGLGRPEKVAALKEDGVRLLRANGLLVGGEGIAVVGGANTQDVEHQLLINWFRIHLDRVGHVEPRLATRFFSAATLPGDGSTGASPLIPDGVFTIGDEESGKTLLFFLEVDRGTEPFDSEDPTRATIRGKILGYRECFRTGAYKRFEQTAKATCNGFRTLFVTNTCSRLRALCQNVGSMRPTGFIWLTDQERMFEHGLSADVWARGGRLDQPLESILGPRLSCPAPLPELTS